MTVTFSLAGLLTFLLVTVRIAAFMMIAPPFAGQSVPMQVRAMLAVAIALPVFPRYIDEMTVTDLPSLVTATVWQILAGLTLGALVLVLFTAVQAAGNLVDLFSMLAMASVLDPLSGTQSSIFGRIYNLLAVTLLFATGGHLLLLRGLLTSFEIVTVGELDLGRIAEAMGSNLDRMMMSALQIGGPILAVLFLTDLALGLVSRAVPSLNVFQLSFPVKMILTVSMASLGVALLPAAVDATLTTILRQFPPVSRMLGG